MSFYRAISASSIRRNLVPIYLLIVLVVGYRNYVHNYDQPPYLFWDENYHIASAQKYLDGVFFMEPHPPLGKLLIALGEYWLDPNEGKDTSGFLTVDHIKSIPEEYSFKGVRLIPTLMSWLSSGIFFLLMLALVQNPHLALFGSLFYLFDNALVLHSRSAMLEGSQLFFILLALLIFVSLFRRAKPVGLLAYGVLSVVLALAFMVKVNSAILLPLLPLLFYFDQLWSGNLSFSLLNLSAINAAKWRAIVWELAIKATMSALCFFAVFLTVWQIHFALCTQIKNNKWYGASSTYKEILARGETNQIRHFGTMLADSYEFFANYQRGVPKLDICKVGENGSYPLSWTVGAKSINYRWEKDKKQEGFVRYLYLQSNPVVWISVLGAVICAVILIGGHFIYGLEVRDPPTFFLIVLFTALYLGYLSAMMQVDRAMYLYHYFIPLLFGMSLISLLLRYGFESEIVREDRWVYASMIFFAVQLIAVFFYFAPFTYYEPISASEVWHRAWISGWKLTPIY